MDCKGCIGRGQAVTVSRTLSCVHLFWLSIEEGRNIRGILQNRRAQTMWQRRNGHYLDGLEGVVTGCLHSRAQDIHVIFKISDQGGGMPKRVQREAI